MIRINSSSVEISSRREEANVTLHGDFALVAFPGMDSSFAFQERAQPGLPNKVEIDLGEHRVKSVLEKSMQGRCEGSKVITREDSSRKTARSCDAQLHKLGKVTILTLILGTQLQLDDCTSR